MFSRHSSEQCLALFTLFMLVSLGSCLECVPGTLVQKSGLQGGGACVRLHGELKPYPGPPCVASKEIT